VFTPSVDCEQASRTLMAELASYRIRRLAENQRFHHRMGSHSGLFGAVPAAYSTVITVVSVAENFIATTLQTAVEDAFNVTSRILQDARDRAWDDLDGTWPKRRDQSKRWFGIDFQAEDCLRKLLIFIDVRNSVAHGIGRLTRKQLGNDKGASIRTAMTGIGIDFRGELLQIDDSVVELCVTTCRESVLWFDRTMFSAALAPATT
jgi:hypothetical protein